MRSAEKDRHLPRTCGLPRLYPRSGGKETRKELPMPDIIEITDFSSPALDVFARLTEAQLRSRVEAEKGVFIAESPKVIGRALDAGYEPLSLLMERRQIEGQGRDIIARCGQVPVYTADRETLRFQQTVTLYQLSMKDVEGVRGYVSVNMVGNQLKIGFASTDGTNVQYAYERTE